MKIDKIVGFKKTDGYLLLIGAVSLCAVLSVILSFGYLFDSYFKTVISVASYLAWHSLFEFFIILISFAVFVVSYYTYDQTNNLRSILFGSVFLTFGSIEIFHTLSFKGMPDFFVINDGANRATTFWIITVTIESLGLLTASFIPAEKKTTINRKFFIFPVLLICILTFITVTYFPDIFPVMYIEGKGLTNIKIILEFISISLLMLSAVKYLIEYFKTRNYLTALLVFALIICIFSEIAFTQYFAVYDIYNYLGHLFRIVAFFIIFRVMFVSNVQKPYYELAEAKNEIKNYADNLDRIVEQRTYEIKRINQKLLDDLEYARDIQKAMLPSKLPDGVEASFCARYFPAEVIGGDYYNVFKIDSQNIALCIGDVSGHGVSAAMLTVFLNQSIKAVKETGDNKFEVINPSDVLKSIYDSFNRSNFRDDIFILFFYAIFNTHTKELTFSSAGINVIPFILREGKIVEFEMQGFPICKIDDIYKVSYINQTMKLMKGDRIILYTDGLIEAENGKNEHFTFDNLKGVLSKCRDKSYIEIANILETTIYNFSDNSPLKDDITILIMQVN